MEYILNMIDPDLRRKVNEYTKEGKVHSKGRKIIINKDTEKDKNEAYIGAPRNLKKCYKKFVVQAVKNETIEIEAVKDSSDPSTTVGEILDIKK